MLYYVLYSELNKDLWKITWEFYLNSVVYHGDLGCAHGDHMSKAGGLILKTGPLHGILRLVFPDIGALLCNITH